MGKCGYRVRSRRLTSYFAGLVNLAKSVLTGVMCGMALSAQIPLQPIQW